MYMKHVKDMLLDKPTSYELSKKKRNGKLELSKKEIIIIINKKF